MNALRCAECGVELTTTDAAYAVPTDAGPVHRECFEGPVPPGGPSAKEILAEPVDVHVEVIYPPGAPTVEEEVARHQALFRDCRIFPPLTDEELPEPRGRRPINGPKASEVVFDEFEALAEATLTPEEEAAENEARELANDVPLPPQIDETIHGTSVRAPDGRRIDPAEVEPVDTDCPECEAEPSIAGGRGLLCRGRSMLP